MGKHSKNRMARKEKINDNQLNALSIVLEEKSVPKGTDRAHGNVFNALYQKGLIRCPRYANGEFWEATDKGSKLIERLNIR